MGLDRWIAIATLLVDIGILWILVEEFNFDKIAYEKEQYKRKSKRRLAFDHLTEGEGR